MSHARLVLPAIRGNPGAAYFTVRNDSGAAVTLIHVDIVGAQTTGMHETRGLAMRDLAQVPIAAGQQVSFAPGARHVMAFGLVPALIPGFAGTIVIRLQGGRTATAPLQIVPAGRDMAGMEMGARH